MWCSKRSKPLQHHRQAIYMTSMSLTLTVSATRVHKQMLIAFAGIIDGIVELVTAEVMDPL